MQSKYFRFLPLFMRKQQTLLYLGLAGEPVTWYNTYRGKREGEKQEPPLTREVGGGVPVKAGI